MRGAPVRNVLYNLAYGIIPAYAGSTWYTGALSDLAQDHPRVCGEHVLLAVKSGDATGSSPRMRGAPIVQIATLCDHGIIPAYAGSTLPQATVSLSSEDHPRVCGEHDWLLTILVVGRGSSPRMRGALVD